MKGDFEGEDDYFNDDDFKKFLKDGEYENTIKGLNINLDNLKINNELSNIDILNRINNGNENLLNGGQKKIKKNKNKNKKKNYNKKNDDDDEWKTSSD